MARVCEITGKKPVVGHNVSHSNRKTKRLFQVNLFTKKFFVPELNKWVTLKVSTSGIKMINKKGIYTCLKESGLIK
jgi:large subunit ribosomal protein L28